MGQPTPKQPVERLSSPPQPGTSSPSCSKVEPAVQILRGDAQWLTVVDQRTIGVFVAVGWVTLAAWLGWSGWRELNERTTDRSGSFQEAAKALDAWRDDGPAYRVEVNSAPWQEWTLLPGIGETTAKRIVEYRDQAGGFGRIDDLRRVRGIGPKTLERLRPYLLLEPPSRATVVLEDHARSGQGSLPWTSSSPANSSLPATSRKPSPL
ncbi:MAG: helix-hairpin-helix domain-containing protein [Planctomycetota bacterium]